MKAIGIHEYGAPGVLQSVTVPDPVPGPRDLVVRVKAAGVNPVDAKVRRGAFGGARPPVTPQILGWDAAGVVEEAGAEAKRFRKGDEVWFAGDIGRAGSYAERCAVDERIVGHKPHSLSFEEAAAVPLVAITAWESLFENLQIPENAGSSRTLLVIGGAGGVGSIAIQLAKVVAGVRVVATASRPESAEFCRRLGADEVIDHAKDLAPQLADRGIGAVDWVHSNAEKNDFGALAATLKPGGRIGCILPAAAADLSALFMKRASVHFEAMFSRPRLDWEPERQGALLDRVAHLYNGKSLQTVATRVMDWSEVKQAHEQIETQHTIGKIVLRIP